MSIKKKVKNKSFKELKHRQSSLIYLKSFIRTFRLSLVVIIFYLFYMIWQSDIFLVKNVQFNGLSMKGTSYINKLNIEDKLLKENILTINPNNIKELVNNKKYFTDVSVKRSLLPSKITINFKERKAYMFFYDKKSKKNIAIDLDGNILPKEFLVNLKEPLIYNLELENKTKLSNKVLNILNELENYKNSEHFINLGTFDLSDPDNIYLLVKNKYVNNVDENNEIIIKYNKILLGNTKEIVAKLKTASIIEPLSKEYDDTLEYIDVRFWRNPVFKRKSSGK